MRSHRIRIARRSSLLVTVIQLAWIASRLVSSNSFTRCASLASCSASIALGWNRGWRMNSLAISLPIRSNGNLRIMKSVVRCNRRISVRIRVDGRNQFVLGPLGARVRAMCRGTFVTVPDAVRCTFPPCYVRAIGIRCARNGDSGILVDWI